MPEIHFHTADSDAARQALEELTKIYNQSSPEEADIIIALGGDGTLLEALHKYHETDKKIYGMNRGSVGFLLNPYNTENLMERLENAQNVTLHPLRMTAHTTEGQIIEAVAFNEVSLLRQRHDAAHISIAIDDKERLDNLICDGVMVATPSGSTAYNLSAHGPIIPLQAEILALTPISPFRPRRWRGALLPDKTRVTFNIHDPENRPVSATADFTEARHVTKVDIHQSKALNVSLLFDPDHNLEERIIKEQFLP